MNFEIKRILHYLFESPGGALDNFSCFPDFPFHLSKEGSVQNSVAHTQNVHKQMDGSSH